MATFTHLKNSQDFHVRRNKTASLIQEYSKKESVPDQLYSLVDHEDFLPMVSFMFQIARTAANLGFMMKWMISGANILTIRCTRGISELWKQLCWFRWTENCASSRIKWVFLWLMFLKSEDVNGSTAPGVWVVVMPLDPLVSEFLIATSKSMAVCDSSGSQWNWRWMLN